MRGDTNFKGSDSSDPTVYSLYCGNYVQRSAKELYVEQELKNTSAICGKQFAHVSQEVYWEKNAPAPMINLWRITLVNSLHHTVGSNTVTKIKLK